MKCNNKKGVITIALCTTLIFSGNVIFAHSGRTDSSGGHKDKNNVSGLGAYHYHCGGHQAHLHPNGICPYSSSGKSNTSNTTSNSASSSSSDSSTSTKPITTVPSTVIATGIQINEKVEELEVGKSKILTATIIPSDVTDKTVTWGTSNTSIATVSPTGEIIAKKAGTVDITASTANGKISTIKINVKEMPKVDNTIIKTSTTSNNNIATTTGTNSQEDNSQEDSNPLGGIIALGLLGGGGYWGYNKYKKNKNNKNVKS